MYPMFKSLFPVLWLLVLSSSSIQRQKNEDSNEFPENSSELLDPERNSLAPHCPKKCSCSSEGIVDCGGFSLKEFPIDVPESTSHLSLQVKKNSTRTANYLPIVHCCFLNPCNDSRTVRSQWQVCCDWQRQQCQKL